MFGGVDIDDKGDSASFESSTSVDSSTLGEEEEEAPVYDATDDFHSEEEETSEEEDDDEDESYEETIDEDLFEEDEEDEEEVEAKSNAKDARTTIDGVVKVAITSMRASHSFASETTEERTHVSTSRAISPENKTTVVSRGALQVDLFPPSSLNLSCSATSVVGVIPISPANSVSTTGTSGSVRRKLMDRYRVPGGAAAKLIGRPTEDNYEVIDDGDDRLEIKPPVEELMESRERAKAEFSKGSPKNRRYYEQKSDGKEIYRAVSSKDDTTPSILSRNKVFHADAAAAIASLLNPATTEALQTSVSQDIVSKLSSKSGDLTTGRPPKGTSKHNTENPFYGPRHSDEVPVIKDAKSDDSNGGDNLPANNSLLQKMMNKKLDRRLDVIKSRMKDPCNNLTELMTAIVPPADGDANRHYMVRRKNACGALKVMTTNQTHRVNLCWTVGVLPALASVLEDSGLGTLEESIPDPHTRLEFFEARKRAVAALMNLAYVDSNRIPMFHCPRLVASLIRVIRQDKGESRRGCCIILSQLSKSKENRYIMAQIPGLVDAVTAVIDPKEGTDVSSPSQDDKSTTANEPRTGGEGEPKDKYEPSEKTCSEDPAEASAKYDEDPNEYLHGARQNVFALLGNLVKEKDNAYILARQKYLVVTLVAITRLRESASQEYGLKLFAHLSRHRDNSKHLVFKMRSVVPAVVFATESDNDESRKYACFTLQNFSQDKPCRQELASIDHLLTAVCQRITVAKSEEEKFAAIHTLKNLTDEPANLIPMTNTPECFATLMQVAHGSDESVTATMQYIACDALATLSHWFRSIATSGQRIGAKQKSTRPKDELFAPTLRVVTWQSWQ